MFILITQAAGYVGKQDRQEDALHHTDDGNCDLCRRVSPPLKARDCILRNFPVGVHRELQPAVCTTECANSNQQSVCIGIHGVRAFHVIPRLYMPQSHRVFTVDEGPNPKTCNIVHDKQNPDKGVNGSKVVGALSKHSQQSDDSKDLGKLQQLHKLSALCFIALDDNAPWKVGDCIDNEPGLEVASQAIPEGDLQSTRMKGRHEDAKHHVDDEEDIHKDPKDVHPSTSLPP
mmetsp:Transcript_32365/g.76037  ORF Transcript_32365/g.76037 Transcript_32365/m.76037 type:complete len:231 (+) Transcript_32365:1184-1876(+)